MVEIAAPILQWIIRRILRRMITGGISIRTTTNGTLRRTMNGINGITPRRTISGINGITQRRTISRVNGITGGLIHGGTATFQGGECLGCSLGGGNPITMYGGADVNMSLIKYLFIVICLLVPIVMGPSVGAAISNGAATSDAGGSTDQSTIIDVQPSDYGKMVEMPEFNIGNTSIGGSSELPSGSFNALWVVDDSGEMNDTLSVPLNSYARVFITPSQAGNVIVEQLNPRDQLSTYNMGVVEPYQTYGIWFYGDSPGTHQMRYSVNGGEYSDVVEFNVG